MASIRTTSFGSAAFDELREVLHSARGGDTLASATVVCHNSIQAAQIRRNLLRHQGLAGLSVVPTSAFLGRLASVAGAPRSSVASNLDIRSCVLAELLTSPGAFESVAQHRSTLDRLMSLRERLVGIPSNIQDRLSSAADGVSGDAFRILAGANARLGDVVVPEQQMELALRALEDLPLHALGPMVWFLPFPRNPLDGRLLATFTQRADTHVLMADSGWSRVDRHYRGLLSGWGAHLPQKRNSEATRPEIKNYRVELSDPSAEVEFALREITQCASEGTPLSSMALLYAVADPFESIIATQLKTAGIPVSKDSWLGSAAGEGRSSVAHSVAVRSLFRLIGLAENGLDRASFFTFLQAAPVVQKDSELVPALIWNEISLDAGVVDSDSWNARLSTLLQHLESQPRESQPRESHPGQSQPSGVAPTLDHSKQRRRYQIDDVKELMSFVVELMDYFDELSEASDWPALTGWCRKVLARYFPDTTDWPHAEREASAALFDVLGEVERAADWSLTPTSHTLSTLLSSELERIRLEQPERVEGLVVAPLDAVVGLPFDKVVIVGVSEGVFPRTIAENPLLGDQLRAVASQFLGPRDRTPLDDVFSFAATICGSKQPAVVTHSRGDLRTTRERRWPRLLDSLVPGVAPMDPIESHYQLVTDIRRPLSSQDVALRDLCQHVESGNPFGSHQLVEVDPVLKEAADFRNRHGSLGIQTVDPDDVSLSERLLSPTAIEAYAGCPRKFLFARVLRINDRVPPEYVTQISPADRGSLLHTTVERFVGEAIESGTVPTPSAEWSVSQIERLLAIAAEEVDEAEQTGLTGGRVQTYILKRSLRTELLNFVATDNQLRSEFDCTPVAVEYEFGFESPPGNFPLSDGRQLRLRGSIDRVDRTSDNTMIVIDYKTGSGSPYRKMSSDPLTDGRTVQLPLYASVVSQQFEGSGQPKALYWLTKEAKKVAVDLDETVTSELDGVVSDVLTGISSGCFPAIPGDVVGYPRVTFENCRYCDFDRICSKGRQREWSKANPDDLSLRELVRQATHG